jgi:hypothetical protein
MTNTLHAHVSTASSDCDGPFYREYVDTFNVTELEERAAANGVNDFSDIHFMNRVFTNNCGPYGVEHGMRITVTNDGFDWYEDTDEGCRSGEVRWCHEDCDPRAAWQRDVFAEQMGY